MHITTRLRQLVIHCWSSGRKPFCEDEYDVRQCHSSSSSSGMKQQTTNNNNNYSNNNSGLNNLLPPALPRSRVASFSNTAARTPAQQHKSSTLGRLKNLEMTEYQRQNVMNERSAVKIKVSTALRCVVLLLPLGLPQPDSRPAKLVTF